MEFDETSQIYELVPGSTEARFLIGEILRGEPTTVVGNTNQVSGQIAVNLDDPSTAAVGPIQVDARTLATDSGFRNRAIETRILLSRVFQYVTFTPTAVTGLPDAVTIGEPVQFQIEGDLTITEYTKPVVFDVTAVPVSSTRIEGSAIATIQRDDFNLFVPSATGVAGVEEAVVLELDFTAEALQ
jgi:polyisoprenoid-binding protein YceI